RTALCRAISTISAGYGGRVRLCAQERGTFPQRRNEARPFFLYVSFGKMDAQMHRNVFSRSRSLKSRGRRPCIHPCIDPENPCIRATTHRTPPVHVSTAWGWTAVSRPHTTSAHPRASRPCARCTAALVDQHAIEPCTRRQYAIVVLSWPVADPDQGPFGPWRTLIVVPSWSLWDLGRHGGTTTARHGRGLRPVPAARQRHDRRGPRGAAHHREPRPGAGSRSSRALGSST